MCHLPKLPDCWKDQLELDGGIDKHLRKIESKLATSKKICPDPDRIFRAFDLCSFDATKVVIIGQDPYTLGQATGLAFGVPIGTGAPSSLRSIFSSIEQDIGSRPLHVSLEGWARQGVLLLNTILTADFGPKKAKSHKGIGWEEFTKAVIEALKAREKGVLFMLWGGIARDAVGMVSAPHKAIVTSHPSPKSFKKNLSGAEPFFGSKQFTEANNWLAKSGHQGIDWTKT